MNLHTPPTIFFLHSESSTLYSPLCQLSLLSLKLKEKHLEAFHTVKCVVEVHRMCLFLYSTLLLKAVTAWLCKPKYCLLCHCIHIYIQVFDSKSTDSVQCFRSKTFSHDTLLLRDTLAFASLVTSNSRDSQTAVVSPRGSTLTFGPLSTFLFGLVAPDGKNEEPEEKRVTELKEEKKILSMSV